MTIKELQQMAPGIEKGGIKQAFGSDSKILRGLGGSSSRVHNGLLRVNVQKLQNANQQNGNKKVESKIAKLEENRTKSEVSLTLKRDTSNSKINTELNNDRSPHISPSTSFSDDKKLNPGPTYERKLLKKKPETSSNEIQAYNSDECIDMKSSRTSSIDKKFWKKVSNSTKRHHSFSHQKKKSTNSLYQDRGYESSHEIKRNNSFTINKTEDKTNLSPERGYQSASPFMKHKVIHADSCISSSAENEPEFRKLRKMSTKRRKSNDITLSKDDVTNANKDEPPVRKTSKFRRRRSSDNIRYKYRNNNKSLQISRSNSPARENRNLSRLISHYSGSAIDESLRSSIVSDTPTDNEDYSSAASDVDYRYDKNRKPGFANRVWRSINSLLQPYDDKAKTDILSTRTPPLLRKLSPDKRLSRSMPEGINKSTKNEKLHLRRLIEKNTLDKERLSRRENTKHNTETSTTKSKKKYKRSKSADYITGLVKNSIYRSNSIKEKFTRKQSLPSLYKRGSNEIKNDIDYNIIISQNPIKDKNIIDKENSKDVLTKNTSLSLTELATDKAKNDNLPKKEMPSGANMRICLNDLKVTLKLELESFLKDKLFDSTQVNSWCRVLSESIKNSVILLTEENYKIISQVFIGALIDNGIHAAIQSTCDKSKDGFFTVTYRGNGMYAIASLLTLDLLD